MDGKRLAGAGSRHVGVLEVIGFVWEFDLIVQYIGLMIFFTTMQNLLKMVHQFVIVLVNSARIATKASFNELKPNLTSSCSITIIFFV